MENTIIKLGRDVKLIYIGLKLTNLSSSLKLLIKFNVFKTFLIVFYFILRII